MVSLGPVTSWGGHVNSDWVDGLLITPDIGVVSLGSIMP